MRERIFRHKPFVVDGQPYKASLTAMIEKFVDLRLSLQADFGSRSFCVIRGLRNFAYYFNYGYWNNEEYSEAEQTVTVTPRMVAALIRFARHTGWSPESSASNHQITITNLEAKSVLENYNSPDREQVPGQSRSASGQIEIAANHRIQSSCGGSVVDNGNSSPATD